MSGKRLLGAVLALGVGLGVLLLWPKGEKTPEAEVRALVARSIEAAEKRDAATIGEAFAEDFKGPGGASKQEVKGVVLGHILRNPNPLVVLNPSLEVTVESPTRAAFKGVFIFARGPGGALGDGASQYEIEARLEKRDDDWLLVSAEWRAR